MKKTITVAIPIYNRADYILESLQSILDQSVKVDEILICDNQSTDNSVEVIKNFINENKDVNVKLIVNEENIGGYNNYKKCKDLCSTDYLLLFSSDDKLKPIAIEKQVQFLDSHPDFALVGGKVDYIDETSNIKTRNTNTSTHLFKKGEILELFEKTNFFIPLSSILLNMKFIKKLDFWDDICTGTEERYWAYILQNHPIAELGETLAEFRIHKDQTSWLDHANNYPELSLYYKTNVAVASLETDPIRRKILKKKLSSWAAARCNEVGKVIWQDFKKPGTATKYWMLGIKLYPKNMVTKSFIKTVLKTTLGKRKNL